MINYSTTDDQRERIHFGIAAISISISSFLLLLDLSFINKVIVPSGFVIYGFLLFLFDKWLWKLRPFNMFVHIPDINGCWKGKNETVVKITQTWRKIDIVVETFETISNVCSATFFIDNEKSKFIKYIYSIKSIRPNPNFNYGEGCAELRIINENNVIRLEVNYFSTKYKGGHFSLTKE